MPLASIPVVLAQAAGGGLGTTLLYVVALLAIMYFVMIRPQQQQQKQQQLLLASLKKGDDVITQGGLLGKIFSVDEKVVTLEIARDVKVRVLKASVQGKVTVEPAKPEPTEAKKEEK